MIETCFWGKSLRREKYANNFMPIDRPPSPYPSETDAVCVFFYHRNVTKQAHQFLRLCGRNGLAKANLSNHAGQNGETLRYLKERPNCFSFLEGFVACRISSFQMRISSRDQIWVAKPELGFEERGTVSNLSQAFTIGSQALGWGFNTRLGIQTGAFKSK